MSERKLYAVVGHYCPTDAEAPDVDGTPGRLDQYVTVWLFDKREDTEGVMDWFLDGVVCVVDSSAVASPAS